MVLVVLKSSSLGLREVCISLEDNVLVPGKLKRDAYLLVFYLTTHNCCCGAQGEEGCALSSTSSDLELAGGRLACPEALD